MSTLILSIAMGLILIGFVTLLTAVLINPQNRFRKNIRLTGMLTTGLDLAMIGLGLIADDIQRTHHLSIFTIVMAGLGIYFGYDSIRQGLAERRRG